VKKYFVKEFLKHRKYINLLKRVHVVVVHNQDVGLIGSGAIAGNLI